VALFAYAVETASSSQIEGTRATFQDAIEAAVKPSRHIPADVDDIQHHIEALRYGLDRLAKDRFPLSLRFVREIHRVLMERARVTQAAQPGEFRTAQNWIGGTRPDNARFVPPPVSEMHRALDDLEKFIHAADTTPVIAKAGIIHAQFETIHPFLDGNGRTGRMLVVFFLRQAGFLEKPLLFLSSYFQKHQELYYERLAAYHLGKVNEWLDFFLDGVIETARRAVIVADKVTTLRSRDQSRIQRLGRHGQASLERVLTQLYGQPIVNLAAVQAWTGFTRAGAQKVVDRLRGLQILSPLDNGRTYGRLYAYDAYLEIFTGDE
jgi:Fic family protein